jgi:hypothetical protein
MVGALAGAVLAFAGNGPVHCGAPIAPEAARAPAAGPVQFRGIRRAAVPKSKVLLWTTEPTRGGVVLRGARCADGTPMRFSYRTTVSDSSLTLDAPAGTGIPGYTLWSKPGKWKLTVWRSGRLLGSVVFCVAPQPTHDPPRC